jgi:hypothetical protein
VTWLVWRRQRLALLLAAGLTAATILMLVVGRVVLETRAAGLGLSACLTDPALDCTSGMPGALLRSELSLYYRWSRIWVWLLVPLLGVIVSAAALAREVEERTIVFALTQATGRLRWWTATVLTTLVPAVVMVVLLTLAGRWGYAPYEVLFRQIRIGAGEFDIQGIWPVASLLVAFALAVFAGSVLRSVLAVIVAAAIGWAVVAATLLVTRYETIPPTVLAVPVAQYDGSFDVDGMPVDMVYRDATRAEVPPRRIAEASCESEDYTVCLARAGVASVDLAYQPSSNFWPLQGIQSGIAVVLSGALLAGSYARVRLID